MLKLFIRICDFIFTYIPGMITYIMVMTTETTDMTLQITVIIT